MPAGDFLRLPDRAAAPAREFGDADCDATSAGSRSPRPSRRLPRHRPARSHATSLAAAPGHPVYQAGQSDGMPFTACATCRLTRNDTGKITTALEQLLDQNRGDDDLANGEAWL